MCKIKKNITKEFIKNGYRISVYNNGILIESTDYHSFPLLLNEKILKELCLNVDRRKTKNLCKWQKNRK